MKAQRFSSLVLLLTTTVTVLLGPVRGSHFRGGTISWKWEGGFQVHFYYNLGWTYGSGAGCTPSLIGQLVTKMSASYWECKSGNCGTSTLHDVNYYCTGANQAENWEQGVNNFTYTFPGLGPFTVAFTGGAWITLSNNLGGGNWNIGTVVDLRTRSDTGTPNSSPRSQSKPMYYKQFNCEARLHIPIIDPDGDTIRCHWAQGIDCESVCNALPNAVLDEETCTLTFNTTGANNYTNNGVYAVALTIQDFPKIPITLNGTTHLTPSDALSSVNLQFLLKTIPPKGRCDAGPRFISPTPKENDVIIFEEGDTATVDLYANNGNDTTANANVITASGPVSMTTSSVTPDVNRNDTFTISLTWKTTHTDLGDHIVCAQVANTNGKSGPQRCFVIKVTPKGCKSAPCQNSGKCLANMGNYTCSCRPGFSGKNCEVNIDDCVPNTCGPGTYCVDGINTFTCHNVPTTTTTTMTTVTTTTTSHVTTTEKNHTGMCPLEYEHCDCTMRPNRNHGHGLGLSRKERDVLGVLFGVPIGLVLSVITFFCVFDTDWKRGTKQTTKALT